MNIELREYKTPLALNEFVLVDNVLCPKEELLLLFQPEAKPPTPPRAVIQIKRNPTRGIAAVKTASEK